MLKMIGLMVLIGLVAMLAIVEDFLGQLIGAFTGLRRKRNAVVAAV